MIGLDLSLTSPGWATPEGHGVLRVPGDIRGMRRLRLIRDAVLASCRDHELALIEGYSFNSHASHAHELGELGGVVRLALFEAGIPFADVPPAVLKKYAAGKGNAKKALMLVEAVKRLGYEGHSHDVADALWLLEMGLDYCGRLTAPRVPQSHRAALEKVAWPERLRAGTESPR